MYLSILPGDFNIQHIQVLDTKPNNIVEGEFTKILYSTNAYIMNGVYIRFRITVIPPGFGDIYSALARISKIQDGPQGDKAGKHQLYFQPKHADNMAQIQKLIAIEDEIISAFRRWNPNMTQTPVYSLKSTLSGGIIKSNCVCAKTPNYILKISGIWTTQTHIGIAYKIMPNYTCDICHSYIHVI